MRVGTAPDSTIGETGEDRFWTTHRVLCCTGFFPHEELPL